MFSAFRPVNPSDGRTTKDIDRGLRKIQHLGAMVVQTSDLAIVPDLHLGRRAPDVQAHPKH